MPFEIRHDPSAWQTFSAAEKIGQGQRAEADRARADQLVEQKAQMEFRYSALDQEAELALARMDSADRIQGNQLEAMMTRQTADLEWRATQQKLQNQQRMDIQGASDVQGMLDAVARTIKPSPGWEYSATDQAERANLVKKMGTVAGDNTLTDSQKKAAILQYQDKLARMKMQKVPQPDYKAEMAKRTSVSPDGATISIVQPDGQIDLKPNPAYKEKAKAEAAKAAEVKAEAKATEARAEAEAKERKANAKAAVVWRRKLWAEAKSQIDAENDARTDGGKLKRGTPAMEAAVKARYAKLVREYEAVDEEEEAGLLDRNNIDLSGQPGGVPSGSSSRYDPLLVPYSGAKPVTVDDIAGGAGWRPAKPPPANARVRTVLRGAI